MRVRADLAQVRSEAVISNGRGQPLCNVHWISIEAMRLGQCVCRRPLARRHYTKFFS
jgi:hypothetical protein